MTSNDERLFACCGALVYGALHALNDVPGSTVELRRHRAAGEIYAVELRVRWVTAINGERRVFSNCRSMTVEDMLSSELSTDYFFKIGERTGRGA